MTGERIAIDDVGKYVDDQDVGIYATQINSVTITGPIGILQWGLAQFGSTGILGYAPTITANAIRLNVMNVE